MPKSEDEREDTVHSSAAKIPEYLVEKLAPRSRDHVVVFGGRLLQLIREVGLSRSALAERFIRVIGMPPMHYLASWRMQVATQKLRNTNAFLAQVAEIVG